MKSGNNTGYEGVWVARKVYEDAERNFYEQLAKSQPAPKDSDVCSLTPLAGEVAKARQRLLETRDIYKSNTFEAPSVDNEAVKFLEKKVAEFSTILQSVMERMDRMEIRLRTIENNDSLTHKTTQTSDVHEIKMNNVKEEKKTKEDDEDLDLFGSDSEDDETVDKVREERLAAYNAKKAKKPTLIAKSSIILDVKPWDDETDMKKMEEEVRKIETDGLLWGAAKLQPLAYGIHKLQITCVVEDEKVSIDWLQEQIEAIEDYVQSVDIAAFNKI